MFMNPENFSKDYSEYFKIMEKTFVENVNGMMKNPLFLDATNQGLQAGLEAKKTFDDMSAEYLERMNMPTRRDIAKILQYLQTIESRILDLEDKVEELSDLAVKKEAPKKPKRSGAAKAKTAKSKAAKKEE